MHGGPEVFLFDRAEIEITRCEILDRQQWERRRSPDVDALEIPAAVSAEFEASRRLRRLHGGSEERIARLVTIDALFRRRYPSRAAEGAPERSARRRPDPLSEGRPRPAGCTESLIPFDDHRPEFVVSLGEVGQERVLEAVRHRIGCQLGYEPE